MLQVIQYGLIAAGLASALVFALVFRYAARQVGVHLLDEGDDLPEATVVSRASVAGAMDPGFKAAKTTQRGFLRVIRYGQACFIAGAITAIFFVFLCLLAMIAVFVAASI